MSAYPGILLIDGKESIETDEIIVHGEIRFPSLHYFDSSANAVLNTLKLAIDNELILHYTFDLDDPSTIKDSSLNRRDGTNNGVTFTTGKYGDCGVFDTDGFITTPTFPFVSAVNQLAFCFWMYCEAEAGKQVFFDGNQLSPEMLRIEREGTTFQLYISGGAITHTIGGGYLNKWTHVVINIDYTANTAYIYFDNVQVDTGAGTFNFPDFNSWKRIGRRSSDYSDDDMDDWRIYDRVLTSQERINVAGNKNLAGHPLCSPIQAIADEDDFASDSDRALATQQSIKAYLDKLLLIGSANSKWVPMIYAGEKNTDDNTRLAVMYHQGNWQNIGADDFDIYFELAIPFAIGAKTLHVKGVRFGLVDANATNKVINLYVYKRNFDTRTFVDSEPTDRTAAGVYTLVFGAAADLAGYNTFYVYLDCEVAVASNLYLSFVEADCYYD